MGKFTRISCADKCSEYDRLMCCVWGCVSGCVWGCVRVCEGGGFVVKQNKSDLVTLIHDNGTDFLLQKWCQFHPDAVVYLCICGCSSTNTHKHNSAHTSIHISTCRDTWKRRPPPPPCSHACMHTFVHSNANTTLTRKASSPILPLWESRPPTWHATVTAREELRTDGNITAATANHVTSRAGFYSTKKKSIRFCPDSTHQNETLQVHLYSKFNCFTYDNKRGHTHWHKWNLKGKKLK